MEKIKLEIKIEMTEKERKAAAVWGRAWTVHSTECLHSLKAGDHRPCTCAEEKSNVDLV